MCGPDEFPDADTLLYIVSEHDGTVVGKYTSMRKAAEDWIGMRSLRRIVRLSTDELEQARAFSESRAPSPSDRFPDDPRVTWGKDDE